MNEFIAKKLGEVHAFQKSALEQFERGQETLEKTYGESFEQYRSQFGLFIEGIERFAMDADMLNIVSDKSEGTQGKLRAMRDTYLTSDEDWANPAEIMEWSSFFYGAGYAHAELVCGAADASENERLAALCRDISKLHHDLLHDAVSFLRELGEKRATEE